MITEKSNAINDKICTRRLVVGVAMDIYYLIQRIFRLQDLKIDDDGDHWLLGCHGRKLKVLDIFWGNIGTVRTRTGTGISTVG
jgi:hypothetical protein